MNFLRYQQALTSGINLLLIALFILLTLQWVIGLKQKQPAGKRFSPLGWQPWWVKIRTSQPSFTYYFGPFPFQWMALRNQTAYCEDLELEQAQDIEVFVLQDEPEQLTFGKEFD